MADTDRRLAGLFEKLDARKFLPRYTALLIAGQRVGQVLTAWTERLTALPRLTAALPDDTATLFRAVEAAGGEYCDAAAIELHPSIASFASRTDALEQCCAALRAQRLLPPRREDGEQYAVRAGAQVLATIDRAAAPWFGVPSVGVHVICFAQDDDDECAECAEPRIWVAQRAADKGSFPLLLDPTVAGGVPHGASVRDHMVAEAAEEAGIDAQLAARALEIGRLELLTSAHPDGSALKTSAYHVFDLHVPARWEPRAADGEVARFFCWTASEVLDVVRRTDTSATRGVPGGNLLFRPAMSLVLVDFLGKGRLPFARVLNATRSPSNTLCAHQLSCPRPCVHVALAVRHRRITAETEGHEDFSSLLSALRLARKPPSSDADAVAAQVEPPPLSTPAELLAYTPEQRCQSTPMHEIVDGLFLGDQRSARGNYSDDGSSVWQDAAAGEVPCAQAAGTLAQATALRVQLGVSAVVCCLDPQYRLNSAATRERWAELHAAYATTGIDLLVLPMSDGADGKLEPHVEEGADFVAARRGEGKRVLVHCSMGKSRSTAVVLTYLMKHHGGGGGVALRACLSLVRSKRPRAYPIETFWHQLIQVERRLLGSVSMDSDEVRALHGGAGADAPVKGSMAANQAELVSAGFPESTALDALRASGNDLAIAFETLLVASASGGGD